MVKKKGGNVYNPGLLKTSGSKKDKNAKHYFFYFNPPPPPTPLFFQDNDP